MAGFSDVSVAALVDLLDGCADGAGLVDPTSGRVIFANSSLTSYLCDVSQSPQNANIYDLSPVLQNSGVQRQLSLISADRQEEVVFQGALESNSGTSRVAEFRFRPVSRGDEVLLAIFVRAEGPMLSAERLQRTDPLTGLADRAFLLERLETLLSGDRAGDQCCAVLFIDVDGFKRVNDAFGHRTGDRVLREVAERLSNCVRSDDHVARFGGDEFVVVLESVCGLDETQPVVERIRAAFESPFATPQGTVRMSVSVGIAEASPGCGTADDLIDAADRAMYAAKRAAVRGSV